MKNVDLVIIGGGPAGLAAAVAARKSGVQVPRYALNGMLMPLDGA